VDGGRGAWGLAVMAQMATEAHGEGDGAVATEVRGEGR
jgi:hypothetical protein